MKKRVEIRTSQHHRDPGSPSVHPAPEPFERIHDLSYWDVRSLGCRLWDEPDQEGGVLLLFPGEWYRSIPDGFRVHFIDGTSRVFKRYVTDDDTRMGCLAYGVRVVKERAVER